MLGKFVTNRQHKVKQMQEPDIMTTIKSIPVILSDARSATKFLISDYENSTNAADSSSLSTSSTIYNSTYNYSQKFDYNGSNIEYNTKIWSQMTRCRWAPNELNFDTNLTIFIENIIHAEVDRLEDCLSDVKYVLNNIKKKI